ncbi:glycosyltransferase family 2 protein [Coleofasciculus sp. FACHB-501]|nr:glycosyltransferase family 2 protein [Coleofasciculus sp. FACHB-501]
MESSKFWKLRTSWFEIKEFTSLGTNDYINFWFKKIVKKISILRLANKIEQDKLVSDEKSHSELAPKYTENLFREAQRSAVIARLEIAKFYEVNFSKGLWTLTPNLSYNSCSTPCISVIVTLFNYSEYIVECLESLAKSVTSNLPGGFEVLVIDDCSTDNSVDIVEAYLNKSEIPICLIKKSLNTGLADARNTGIKLARAPYIFILDADNWIYPNCFPTLYREIQSGKYASVYSLIGRFDSKSGEEIGLLSCYPWSVERLVKNPYIDAMAMFSRETVLKVGGYSTELIHHGWFGWEDYDLWLKLAQSDYACKLVPQVLCSYRVHTSSMINTTNYYTYNIAKYFVKKFAGFVEQYAHLDTLFGFKREDIT